jgi:hypothetical protein
MNYFLKYRFAIWGLIILTIIVLSSLCTFLVLKQPHKYPEMDPRSRMVHFFKDELKLTPEQQKILQSSRHEFFQRVKVIFDSLESKRLSIVQELCKEKPDSAVLYQLSDQVGLLHAQLKKESINNLLNLRSICTPEQVKKLNTINGELIGPEGPIHRMGKRPPKKPN